MLFSVISCLNICNTVVAKVNLSELKTECKIEEINKEENEEIKTGNSVDTIKSEEVVPILSKLTEEVDLAKVKKEQFGVKIEVKEEPSDIEPPELEREEQGEVEYNVDIESTEKLKKEKLGRETENIVSKADAEKDQELEKVELETDKNLNEKNEEGTLSEEKLSLAEVSSQSKNEREISSDECSKNNSKEKAADKEDKVILSVENAGKERESIAEIKEPDNSHNSKITTNEAANTDVAVEKENADYLSKDKRSDDGSSETCVKTVESKNEVNAVKCDEVQKEIGDKVPDQKESVDKSDSESAKINGHVENEKESSETENVENKSSCRKRKQTNLAPLNDSSELSEVNSEKEQIPPSKRQRTKFIKKRGRRSLTKKEIPKSSESSSDEEQALSRLKKKRNPSLKALEDTNEDTPDEKEPQGKVPKQEGSEESEEEGKNSTNAYKGDTKKPVLVNGKSGKKGTGKRKGKKKKVVAEDEKSGSDDDEPLINLRRSSRSTKGLRPLKLQYDVRENKRRGPEKETPVKEVTKKKRKTKKEREAEALALAEAEAKKKKNKVIS